MSQPLRKTKSCGTPYTRPAKIEEAIARFRGLSPQQLAEVAQGSDADSPQHVPSECLVYFLRIGLASDAVDEWEPVFRVLRERIFNSLVRRRHALRGDSATDLEVEESVLGVFTEKLCEDRVGYCDKLDFFEVRFNLALKALRTDQERKVGRRASREEPLLGNAEGKAETVSSDTAKALVALLESRDTESRNELYRSEVAEAIRDLPPDQQRVIHLLSLGMPITSADPDEPTITKALGCVEKTVHNRRDRAFATMRLNRSRRAGE